MTAFDKRSATFTIGGTEYSAQVSKYEINGANSDSDFVTFAQAAAGGAQQYTLQMTLVQDAASGTLFDRIWTSPGATVACVFKPLGGATATPAAPWYTFSAVIQEPDGPFLGGEADASVSAFQTIDVEWPLLARPVRQTS